MSTSALSALSGVPAFVIEEHVASTNRFLQLSRLTLDDLHVYAEPLNDAALAVKLLAHRSITSAQAAEMLRQSAVQYRAIDDALEAAADAEDAEQMAALS